MDQIGREVEECGDALQAMELYEKFTSTFARINEDTELVSCLYLLVAL